MNKDTRFSIRKLTVGVASIAVASFLTSGSVDAADLSILHSKDEKAAGYNPELPFEPFPPSISYTQPEAPWMQGSLDTVLPSEEVTEPRKPNYEDPEAPFAPVEEEEEVTEPRKPNYEDPEAPFAPVEEEEEVTEPRKPNYEDPEAPFAPVEEEEEVTEPRKPNYEDPEAPFAPVEEEEEVTEPRKPNYEDPEAPFAPVEEEEEVTEPRKPNYENPEAPFAPVEEEEEVTEPRKPNYEDPEAPFAPVEEEEEVTEPRKPNYEDPESPFAPVEEEEDSPALEVKVVQETETLPYETERRENADLYVGDEEIVTPGQEGKIVKEYEVTYAGDKEVSRKELRVVESVDPVTEIVEYGTKPVQDTKVETRRVEEVLPIVEQEDPELPEGESRTEQGTPKVTMITEEIIFERGKEVSREIIKKEVIDEGTAEIKYIGIKRVETITETKTIPYETERRENADLYVGDEEIVTPGQEGKVVKEFEVTYAGDKEVSRKEIGVVESVDPVKEIIEFGTKPVKDTKKETRRVEEALPVVEKEDPELLKGQTRIEPGTPKVTMITEEIIFERGKEVSRKTIKEEVIDEGTAEIKYVGIKRVETITETKTIPYEIERRENADLYVGDEEIVTPGQEGKVVKEFEVIYAGDQEVDRKELREVESVDPVTEIVEYGTKPVMTTGTEKHQVKEALPVVEKDDPELLVGQTRTEPGSPKVTEITEEITYKRGKEVSREIINKEVIDQGTAEIKYVGVKRVETKTVTEKLPFKEERRENPDLYEGTERVIQEGKEGSVTKEYEVTYIKGKEIGQTEPREVDRVEPENKIIEYGIKEDKLVEWDVTYNVIPLPSTELKDSVVEMQNSLNEDVKGFYDQLISENGGTDSSSTDELTDDQKAQVLASALDYYRKATGDETIKLEQLITDSKDKKGSFYETLVLAGANKLGITEIEEGQDPDYYKNILLENQAYDGKQIYKDIVVQENLDGTLTSGKPSPETVSTAKRTLQDIRSLLGTGHWVFTGLIQGEYEDEINKDIPEKDKKKLQAQLEEIKNFDKLDTTAASLDFYRVLTNKPEATLQDVLIDWAHSEAGLTQPGAFEMVRRYDPNVGGGTDMVETYMKLIHTRYGQLMESELTSFLDPFVKILEGIGETPEP